MSFDIDITSAQGSFEVSAQFSTPRGITMLFGPSGAGKSTIINAVAGLVTPKLGHIHVDEHVFFSSQNRVDLPVHIRRLGYIFQEGRLFPHMTIQRNLHYGRRFSRSLTPVAGFDDVVDILDLSHLLTRRPIGLSGGEKQRVAIGRALLASPRLILADEPLAALDQTRKTELLPYFERLRDELNIPILYVTHSIAEVARLATTVVTVSDGRVTSVASPEQTFANDTVMPDGQAGALINAYVKCHHDDGLSELDAAGIPLHLPMPRHPLGTKVRLRIAAQDVVIATHPPKGLSALNIISGRILRLTSGNGSDIMLTLDTPAGKILARLTKRSASSLELIEGMACCAIIKSMALADESAGSRYL